MKEDVKDNPSGLYQYE